MVAPGIRPILAKRPAVPTATPVKSSHPARGVILMAVAMLVMPLVDGLAKHLSINYSPLFIGWARYAMASLIVLPFAAALNGLPLFPRERLASPSNACRSPPRRAPS